MKNDRVLIALSKTHTLEDIADQLERSPKFVLRRALRLGLSIRLRQDESGMPVVRSVQTSKEKESWS
jgi:hypothetical protein